MEYTHLPSIDQEVSRIGIGTWAIGGVHWGGTDPRQSIDAIHAGLDRGVNLIDTAPVYGFGLSEEIVGSAVRKYGSRSRDELIVASKAGLEWDEDDPSGDEMWRNSRPDRIREEIEASLQRLQMDYIDLYQVHWPDPEVPLDRTAEVMNKLKKEGKIRAVGVSNYDVDQIRTFTDGGTYDLDTVQPLYNLFEPKSGEELLPYCRENGIGTLTYSVLCRGLLSGKMSEDRSFDGDDVRNIDPKFQSPRFRQYLDTVEKLDEFARDAYGKRVHQLAARWVLDTGADVALWGLRRPEQAEPFEGIGDWSLTDEDLREIRDMYRSTVEDPVEEGLPGPPANEEEAR